MGGKLTFVYSPAERDLKKRLRAALKPGVDRSVLRRGKTKEKTSGTLDLSFAGLSTLEPLDEEARAWGKHRALAHALCTNT